MIIETADSRQQTADSRQQTADSRQQTADSRCHYFDFLRVAATFTVVLLHATREPSSPEIPSFDWLVLHFWHGSIVRWAVPVFVMISGALFLGREIPLRKIYGKYIFRIFTAFLFWSFFYAIAEYMLKHSVMGALAHFIEGHIHLWFLFMISMLYAVQPILKRIADSESLTKYFLVIAFFFTFLFPETVKIISLFSEKYSTFAVRVIDQFYFHFTLGFTAYFLLGHFLNTAEISPKTERLIYTLGIISLIAGICMSTTASIIAGKSDFDFYNSSTVNILFESMAVFVFFKKRMNFPSKVIRVLSQYSFGIFLVHAAVLGVLYRIGFTPLKFSPLISVPAIALTAFIISLAISAVLHQIPVLKKYVV